MPYIPDAVQEERLRLDPIIDALVKEIHAIIEEQGLDIRDADGRLNYSICQLLMKTLDMDTDPRYTKYNTLQGILKCVGEEIQDRVGRPYEDHAISKNGDIEAFHTFEETMKSKER